MQLRHALFVHARRLALPLLFLALIATPVRAQQAEVSDGPANAITINPLFLLAGWISAYYEHRVNGSISVGGGINYLDYDRDRYTIFEGSVRLYPNEHALRGFGFSASLGVAKLSFIDDDAECPANCEAIRRKLTSPALGVELSYQWMLGKSRRTATVLALGGERFLASRAKLEGTSTVIGTARLGLGYAF